MDRNVLKAQMQERFEATWEEACKAVETAPDGQWIAGSEWQVQEAFQKLMADCYREIVQSRIDALPSEKQAAFPLPKARDWCCATRACIGPAC